VLVTHRSLRIPPGEPAAGSIRRSTVAHELNFGEGPVLDDRKQRFL
jgi:hypothetical protein